MRTQSRDTHPEAERILIDLIRVASSQKRFRLVQSLSQGLIWTKVHHVGKSEPETAVAYVASRHGADLAAYVQKALEHQKDWSIHSTDLLAVLFPAFQTFIRFGIAAYVGGSLASSLHGMQQAAADLDLVVDLPDPAPLSLIAALQAHYILDETTVVQALQRRRAFALIHLDTLKKVHVIPPSLESFDQAMRQLVTPLLLDEHYPSLPIASLPEMVLWKLRRYQHATLTARNGLEDDATWNDVLGMLKVQMPTLDYALLDQWTSVWGLCTFWTVR